MFTPRDPIMLCVWCEADYHDAVTERCPRCNAPFISIIHATISPWCPVLCDTYNRMDEAIWSHNLFWHEHIDEWQFAANAFDAHAQEALRVQWDAGADD
jgi:hypothetical protein